MTALPISENDVKTILDQVGLTFSPKGLSDVCIQVRGYHWMFPLFDEIPTKDEQIEQLKELGKAATTFKECITNLKPSLKRHIKNLYTMNVFPNEMEAMAQGVVDATGLALKDIYSTAGKRGRKTLLSRRSLISSLMITLLQETGRVFVLNPGIIGRGGIKESYAQYNPEAFSFIFKIISSVDPKYTKNRLQKDIEYLISKGIVKKIYNRSSKST